MAYCGACGSEVASRFCADCGTPVSSAGPVVDVAPGEDTSVLFGSLAHDDERGTATPGTKKRWTSSTAAGVAASLALLVGVGGVTVALQANAQTNDLKDDVARLNRQVAAAQASSDDADKQVKTLAGQMTQIPGQAAITAINNKLAKFINCVPQLQTEINGLTVSWQVYGDATKDYFGISNNSQVSNDCTQTLYGANGTD